MAKVEMVEIPAEMVTGEYLQDGVEVAVIVIPLDHSRTEVTPKGNCTLGNLRETIELRGKNHTFQGLVYRHDRK
jgi:hypothetical protein